MNPIAATLPQPAKNSNPFGRGRQGLLALVVVLALEGCRMTEPYLRVDDQNRRYAAGTIVAANGKVVDREALMADLAEADVVYVGETHTSAEHHRIQLDILKGLKDRRPDVAVAMEMFDKTYQPILERWSKAELDEKSFVEKTHWYANWRFDFALYRDIFDWIKARQVPLIGLNLPFYLPARIAVGGLDSLAPADKAFLPERIDLNDTAHRAMLEPTLAAHRHMKGRDNIDYLYQAQCAWDDAMAEVVARAGPGRPLVVLIGNGHIAHKHGVPNRAFARNRASFRTIALTEARGQVRSDLADYVWVTQ